MYFTFTIKRLGTNFTQFPIEGNLHGFALGNGALHLGRIERILLAIGDVAQGLRDVVSASSESEWELVFPCLDLR